MLASIENLNGKTSTVLIEVSSSTEGISHQYQMTSSKFIQKLNNAEYSEEEFSDKYLNKKVKSLPNSKDRLLLTSSRECCKETKTCC